MLEADASGKSQIEAALADFLIFEDEIVIGLLEIGRKGLELGTRFLHFGEDFIETICNGRCSGCSGRRRQRQEHQPEFLHQPAPNAVYRA